MMFLRFTITMVVCFTCASATGTNGAGKGTGRNTYDVSSKKARRARPKGVAASRAGRTSGSTAVLSGYKSPESSKSVEQFRAGDRVQWKYSRLNKHSWEWGMFGRVVGKAKDKSDKTRYWVRWANGKKEKVDASQMKKVVSDANIIHGQFLMPANHELAFGVPKFRKVKKKKLEKSEFQVDDRVQSGRTGKVSYYKESNDTCLVKWDDALDKKEVVEASKLILDSHFKRRFENKNGFTFQWGDRVRLKKPRTGRIISRSRSPHGYFVQWENGRYTTRINASELKLVIWTLYNTDIHRYEDLRYKVGFHVWSKSGKSGVIKRLCSNGKYLVRWDANGKYRIVPESDLMLDKPTRRRLAATPILELAALIEEASS